MSTWPTLHYHHPELHQEYLAWIINIKDFRIRRENATENKKDFYNLVFLFFKSTAGIV